MIPRKALCITTSRGVATELSTTVSGQNQLNKPTKNTTKGGRMIRLGEISLEVYKNSTCFSELFYLKSLIYHVQVDAVDALGKGWQVEVCVLPLCVCVCVSLCCNLTLSDEEAKRQTCG